MSRPVPTITPVRGPGDNFCPKSGLQLVIRAPADVE